MTRIDQFRSSDVAFATLEWLCILFLSFPLKVSQYSLQWSIGRTPSQNRAGAINAHGILAMPFTECSSSALGPPRRC